MDVLQSRLSPALDVLLDQFIAPQSFAFWEFLLKKFYVQKKHFIAWIETKTFFSLVHRAFCLTIVWLLYLYYSLEVDDQLAYSVGFESDFDLLARPLRHHNW